MLRRHVLITAAAGATSLALPGCGGSDPDKTGDSDNSKSIADLAATSPDLSFLAEAANAAGLIDTLKATGPLTLFAPSNAAFDALLSELSQSKEAFLADKTTLAGLLKYHVLSTRTELAKVAFGKQISTTQGNIFKIDNPSDGPTITDGRNRSTRIVTPDVGTSNGVVHLIDKVLLPPDKAILQVLQARSQYSLLVDALIATNVSATLVTGGPYTVFAPDNAAFNALLGELGITSNALLANTALLTSVLNYHVLPNRLLAAELPLNTAITTVQTGALRIGDTFAITDRRGRVTQVTAPDLFANNGVIHAVNRVLLPSA